jgi:hypothetical protein
MAFKPEKAMANGTTDVEFIVTEKRADGRSVGLGAHKLRVPPRVGEFVGMDDDKGVGQAYQVVGVILDIDPSVLIQSDDSGTFREAYAGRGAENSDGESSI